MTFTFTPPAIYRNKYDEMLALSEMIDKLVSLHEKMNALAKSNPDKITKEQFSNFNETTEKTLYQLNERLVEHMVKLPPANDPQQLLYICADCEFESPNIGEAAKHRLDNRSHSIASGLVP